MDLVNYLANIYGYDTPIFIKDVRIGRKSKSAIREEFYRASKRGDINRDGPGVYSLVNKTNEIVDVVTFEKILMRKYLTSENAPRGLEKLFVEGYYSGLTFLNMIGLSEQVPAIPEITTNRISSKKYVYNALGRTAFIRKSRTTIDSSNYEILQFLDMFYYITMDEVKKNKELIIRYVKEKRLTKYEFTKYIGLYGVQTMKKIVEGGIINAFM